MLNYGLSRDCNLLLPETSCKFFAITELLKVYILPSWTSSSPVLLAENSRAERRRREARQTEQTLNDEF